MDRFLRALALVALRGQCEIDHHDRVLLDDADQEDHADQRDDAQIVVQQHQREQRADAGRGEGRQDRDRVDVALVEHAEHDVDDEDRGSDQERGRGQRRLESLGGAAERASDGRRQAQFAFQRLDAIHRLSDRYSRRQIERQRYRRELSLVIDRERLHFRGKASKAAQRHLRPVRSRNVDLRQGVRIVLEFGLRLEDDLVLVGRGVHRRDFALPERVVQGLVDRRG